MKLLYLANIRLPTEKAHGVQIMKMCEAFAGFGHEITLMIPGRMTHIHDDPFTYYGVRRIFTIKALHTPDWIPWGSIGFVLSALWFSEAARMRKEFWEADIIYSRDAFVLLQYVLLGKTLIYEAHTAPTRISTYIAKCAQMLVVISGGLRDAYKIKGIAPKNMVVAHDAVDPELFCERYDQKESRIWLGIPLDKKIALYVGRIDSEKGADVFAAASESVPEGVQCVFVGQGSLTPLLAQKYPKALFLPETPYRDLPRVLAAADVLVIPNSSKNINAARYTSPLKAFAYLASEKPIVASDVPALREILEGKASFFMADDSAECARAIMAAMTQFVRKSLDQCMSYTWEKRARIILDFIPHA